MLTACDSQISISFLVVNSLLKHKSESSTGQSINSELRISNTTLRIPPSVAAAAAPAALAAPAPAPAVVVVAAAPATGVLCT